MTDRDEAKSPLDVATHLAVRSFADRASLELLRRMSEERRLSSTECAACQRIAWPPRDFCPFCSSEDVAWVDIGEGATLYAFTTQERALRFQTPAVIGLVSIPRVGNILSAIDAPYEALRIGMPLRLDFLEIAPGLFVHRFRPTRPD